MYVQFVIINENSLKLEFVALPTRMNNGMKRIQIDLVLLLYLDMY